MMTHGLKFDQDKPASYLLAHDVVINDHNPSQDIQFYAARLREWWNLAGTLPALQLDNADYFGAVKILEHGAVKYAARNWESGIHYSRVFRAAMDHYAQRGSLDEGPKGSGLPHRHHFLCCYMFLAAYTARGMHDFDDRPTVGPFYTPAQVRSLLRCYNVGLVVPGFEDITPARAASDRELELRASIEAAAAETDGS